MSASAARRGNAVACAGMYARRWNSHAARQTERPQTPPGAAAFDENDSTPRIGTAPRQRTLSSSTSMSSATSGSNHTPRTSTFPPSALSSSTSSGSPSRPLHTPPTLLPRGSSTLHTYASSSSFHAPSTPRTPTASYSSSLQPAYSDSGRSSSADDSSSVSSDDNTWATSFINQPGLSTSNPDSSGFMFSRFVSPPLAPPASSALDQPIDEGTGARESRPLSEFDWAAAYGGSSPSLAQSQATAPPDSWTMTNAASASPASRPLPPLPDSSAEAAEGASGATSEEVEATRYADANEETGGEEEQPPPVPLEQKPSLLHLDIATGPKGTAGELSASRSPFMRPLTPDSTARARAAAAHPAVALDSALPSSPSTSVLSASPTSAGPPPAPSTALLAPAPVPVPSDRPSSRASSRSLGSQPPRPPRRQPSNLSLAGARSDVSAEPLASASSFTAEPASVEAAAVDVNQVVQQASASSAVAEGAPTNNALTSLDAPKLRTTNTSRSERSDSSPPSTTPAAAVSPGSARRVPSGPAPSIPSKSARRASTLVTRRISLVNGVHKQGESVDTARTEGEEREEMAGPSASKIGSPLIESGGDDWSTRCASHLARSLKTEPCSTSLRCAGPPCPTRCRISPMLTLARALRHLIRLLPPFRTVRPSSEKPFRPTPRAMLPPAPRRTPPSRSTNPPFVLSTSSRPRAQFHRR